MYANYRLSDVAALLIDSILCKFHMMSYTINIKQHLSTQSAYMRHFSVERITPIQSTEHFAQTQHMLIFQPNYWQPAKNEVSAREEKNHYNK